MIRPATSADASAVLAAYEWLFDPPGGRPAEWDAAAARERLVALIESDSGDALVAEEDEIVGLCTVYLDILSVRFGQRAWVEDLAVAPAGRSRGTGKALLDAAKAWARERGASHLELDSAFARVDAHRFYEREQPAYDSRSFGWRL